MREYKNKGAAGASLDKLKEGKTDENV